MPDTNRPSSERPAPLGHEPFRPHYHFTPRRNWINDPNGLVYFAGEYHLFFQYNPFGSDWGHMSWGHAVSADLVHWRELAVAIPERDQMIFSGSAVIDWHNQAGLGDGENPPMLAFFTAFDARRNIQSQHLAVSGDHGRSFRHYAGNPVIDLGRDDFRDPKVFYHAASAAWIMVAVLARAHAVQFWRSQNLRDWQLTSAFGPHGSVSGQWECPDLICLPIAGGGSAWVLKVDVDTGLVDGGSGAQYFVGDFDGHSFTIDPQFGCADGALVDHGPDFYAAVSWGDLPESCPAPIWIGWQSNHQSGKLYPTDPWRGAMSLPRTLGLIAAGGRHWLAQTPVAALAGLRGAAIPTPVGADGTEIALPTDSSAFEADLRLAGDFAGAVELRFCDESGALLTVALTTAAFAFTRHGSPLVPSPAFARATTARRRRPGGIDLRIFFDGALVEIFADGGMIPYSACLFPTGALRLELAGTDGASPLRSATSWPMRRAMDFSA